ncbi:MAG TPA: GNAT family N-acetyltransferase [Dehalococcoidia bacterium]|nr:GNAT family N-acetyltransferase [Dehalococcoidia bacterium]
MPDMLVRLYDLPDASDWYDKVAVAGYRVRRAEAWERARFLQFIKDNFGPVWATESEQAFSQAPVTAFVAEKERALAGFAAYECTRRGFFGPTGVRPDARGEGLGAALLFRCLESMREMGYGYAVIGGVGPAAFYEKVCGAFVIPGSETSVYGPLWEMLGKEQA